MVNLHCECPELKPKGETNSSFLVLHPSSGVHTVKTVGSHLKFTRHSGGLARDEFLVIFKEDHTLTYMCTFAVVLLFGTVLHCTTYFVFGISSLVLIRVNLSITFQNHIMFCRTII